MDAILKMLEDEMERTLTEANTYSVGSKEHQERVALMQRMSEMLVALQGAATKEQSRADESFTASEELENKRRELDIKEMELKELKLKELELKARELDNLRQKELELKQKELDEFKAKELELKKKELELKEQSAVLEDIRAEKERDQKSEELDEAKRARRWENGIAVVGIGVPALLSTWMTCKALKFEETGTFTSKTANFVSGITRMFKKG